MIMPYKSKRRCKYQGCPELVDAGAGFCADHRSAVKYSDTSHYDRRWRKVRELTHHIIRLCSPPEMTTIGKTQKCGSV